MILHIDMDAFFASVEQARDPRLKGKPIAVAGGGSRTVITTASYEARKYGIRTGNTVPEAKKKCPHLTIVVADFNLYAATSEGIIEIFNRYAATEVYSIDEAFLDISRRDPFPIAMAIKEDIRARFNITCSAGAGRTKTIAKLVSGINKPDGYFHAEEFGDIKDLPIKEVWGIGRKNSRKLALSGIQTIEEFCAAENAVLRQILGIGGLKLKLALLGRIAEPVNPEPEPPKSVSNSMTLERDIWHKAEIEKALFQLCEKVGHRLRKHKLWGRRITLYVRYTDFETFGLETRHYTPTFDDHEICDIAMRLLSGIRLVKPVRLLGICVGDLCPVLQYNLFDSPKKRQFLYAVDTIRKRWGFNAATWGIVADKIRHNPPISPAWRPGR